MGESPAFVRPWLLLGRTSLLFILLHLTFFFLFDLCEKSWMIKWHVKTQKLVDNTWNDWRHWRVLHLMRPDWTERSLRFVTWPLRDFYYLNFKANLYFELPGRGMPTLVQDLCVSFTVQLPVCLNRISLEGVIGRLHWCQTCRLAFRPKNPSVVSPDSLLHICSVFTCSKISVLLTLGRHRYDLFCFSLLVSSTEANELFLQAWITFWVSMVHYIK